MAMGALKLPEAPEDPDDRDLIADRVLAGLRRALEMAEADLADLEKARELSRAQGQPAWEHASSLRTLVTTLRTIGDGLLATRRRNDPRPRGGR